MGSWSTLSSETQFLDANTPNAEWQMVQPREKDHEYSVSHFEDHFYIVTNDNAKNFKLVKTPINATKKDLERIKELLKKRKNTFKIYDNLLINKKKISYDEFNSIYMSNQEEEKEKKETNYSSYIIICLIIILIILFMIYRKV